MTTDLDKLAEAIWAVTQAKKAELDAKLDSQVAIAILRVEIKRLEAAKLALTAKQSPEGRKRISEAARKPRKKEAARASVASANASPITGAICDHCKCGLLTDDMLSGPTSPCGADGCDFMVHAGCLAAHRAKFHWEAKWEAK